MTLGQFFFSVSVILGGAYSVLTAYPEALIDKDYASGNITIHSRVPLSAAAQAMLPRVQEKIAADDFFDPAQKFEVYIAHDRPVYSLLAPLCRRDFACMNPITEKVFIAAADPEKDLAFNPGGNENPRTLENVITHELVKAQVRHKLGLLIYLSLSPMKKEGYAEHVTMETYGRQPNEICEAAKNSDTLTRYLEQRLALELVQFEADVTYPALLRSSKGDDASVTRLRQKYCN